jgi:hypothetical protein
MVFSLKYWNAGSLDYGRATSPFCKIKREIMPKQTSIAKTEMLDRNSNPAFHGFNSPVLGAPRHQPPYISS